MHSSALYLNLVENTNMMSNMSQEEIDRNKNLVEGSDNSDSINELNKEC